jgi:hypothetical protein
MVAKFWLEPARLGRNEGFGKAEVRRIQKLINSNEAILRRRWDEFFTD